jgi:hypothetical protein
MTYASLVSPIAQRRLPWILTLIAASLLFSFAIACAVPLAGFAAIAAITLGRRDALLSTGAIWLANQAVGFGFLHYPTDAATLAWGGALGVIALLSCEAAGAMARRLHAATGAGVAFLAAFVVYEGAIVAITAATGPGADHFALATVSWVFFVNAGAFVGLFTLRAAISALTFEREATLTTSGRA